MAHLQQVHLSWVRAAESKDQHSAAAAEVPLTLQFNTHIRNEFHISFKT